MGTLLFHTVLIFMLFLMKCGTGGGGGNNGFGYTGLMSMEVAAMGNDVDGWGNEPEEEAPVQNAVSDPVTQDNAAITDDNATVETPVVNNKPNSTPVTKPNDIKTKPNKDTKPQEVSGNLNNAFGQLNKGGNGTTSGSGKQGTNDGKIDSKGVSSGGGSAGTGGGQGGGIGTGNGTGTGPGSGAGSGGGDFQLKGRDMKRNPSIDETAPEEGFVVVDIWVDKDGNVTKAVANPSKSTSSSAKLYKLAEKAAKNAKFSSSSAVEQKGTISINFKLH